MRLQTETAIRGILALDDQVRDENIEAVISLLKGEESVEDEEVLTRMQVAKLLKKHIRTVDYYIKVGHLDRVFGSGKRGIGVSRSSFLRFIKRRVERRTREGGRS